VVTEQEALATFTLDPDIEPLLGEILQKDHLNALRDTEAYHLGRIEERLCIVDEGLSDIKNKMALPAEIFHDVLLKIISQKNLLQHRIGVDYSTGVPTVLSVISNEMADKLPLIRRIARTLELFFFDEHECNCNFWTIVDYNLSQSQIELDFPYYRKTI
jgi:hypothetical protein